jgi:hypothetical protein
MIEIYIILIQKNYFHYSYLYFSLQRSRKWAGKLTGSHFTPSLLATLSNTMLNVIGIPLRSSSTCSQKLFELYTLFYITSYARLNYKGTL